MTPKDFVKKYKPFALESEKKTGISHLFTLAQAALESRWGERAEGYNFFGIKAKATTPLPNKQLWVTKEELAVPNSNKKGLVITRNFSLSTSDMLKPCW